ncbi:MAG: hypothetical protein NTZ33_05055 [Bacteroidetes bacterium]|nr:hypothetical protein [Bacteroidota bacterium]
MKKLIIITVILGYIVFTYPLFSQNNGNPAPLGLAGDDLNLYGVLDLFQQSATLEEFEQKLNAEDTKLNNLDLDRDGKTDYIKVIDHINGTSHAIVLQDVINENESQDVAVIEVDRDKDNQVRIQIIGDEQLYGKNYIIEPVNGTPNPGYTGNASNNTTVVNNNYTTNNNYNNNRGYYNAVGSWHIIHFIYDPVYVVYVSPWRWGYYPSYWRPWHQWEYNDYYGYWGRHHSHAYYHQTNTYNVPAANTYYGPRRTTSNIVQQRSERGEFKRDVSRSNPDLRTVNPQNQNMNNRTVNPQYQNNNNRNANIQTRPENRNSNYNNNTNQRRDRAVEKVNKPNRAEQMNKRSDNVKAAERKTESRPAVKAKLEETEKRR